MLRHSNDVRRNNNCSKMRQKKLIEVKQQYATINYKNVSNE